MKLEIAEYHTLLRGDLYGFIERSFYELNPETPFVPNWHIEVLAAELEACRRGETKRLIINKPPRSLKSHCASVAFPAWLMGHNPSEKIITVSYGQDLADKYAQECRTVMMSEWYRSLFPTRLSPPRQLLHDFRTIQREDCCISVDCAFKDKATGSRVAAQVWGRRGADFYLLARNTDHMNLARTLDAVRRFAAEWPEAIAKYIEDKANGPAVMEILHDELPGMIPVQVGQAQGDKVARLHAVSPLFESLHVFLPDPVERPWILDVINEWCTAPNSAGWDDTDAMTQALSKMQRRGGGLFELYKQQAEEIEKRKKKLAEAVSAGQQPQAEKDKAFKRLGRVAQLKDLAAVVVPEQAPACPRCGKTKFVARYAEGGRRCNECGMTWLEDVGRGPREVSGFRF